MKTNKQGEITGLTPVQTVQKVEETQMSTAESLISQALAKGLPMETIKELLAMRKELKAEAAKEAYDEAMANFQAECPVVGKDKEVKNKAGAVLYSYAPLDAIVSMVKEFIGRNGFSYAIKTEITKEFVKVFCVVKHKMGHSETTDMEVPMGTRTEIMSAPQVVAATTTFAKRYAFCNAFGIMTGDEDNDRPPVKEDSKATDVQHNKIVDLAQKAGVTMADVTTRCRADYGVSIIDITATQAMGIIDRLNNKISKMNVV